MNACRLSASCCAANDFLPIGACTMPLLSTRNSILPAFSSFTAFVTSIVTVPAFGFGISPRGPRIFPSAPSCPITSGVATMTSVSIQPSLIFCTYSTPTKSAPAASASLIFSPCAITSTRTFFPCRAAWKPCRARSDRRAWDRRPGAPPRPPTRRTSQRPFASPARQRRQARTACAARWWRRQPGTSCRGCASALHHEAHGTRRARDHVDRAFEIGRVQVLHLQLGDFLELGARDLADLLPVGGRRTLLDARFLLEQDRGRRGLGHKREGAVLVDRHDNGRDHSGGASGFRVELLHEFHDVDAVGPQRRAHRGSRRRLPGRHLQLHDCGDWLGHRFLYCRPLTADSHAFRGQ